jgi:hypothetical protein
MNVDLQSLLQSLGIAYDQMEDGTIVIFIGTGEEDAPSFPLMLFTWTGSDERGYISLVITPFVERPEEDYPPELFSTVLMMNDQMPRCKFMLDEEGDLALSLDMDAEELNAASLRRALELIGMYADNFFPEICGLCGVEASE